MAKKKVLSRKVRVFGTKFGAIVEGVSAAEVRKALQALEQRDSWKGRQSADTKTALKLHAVLKRFFSQGGRFKRPFKRKPKKA